MIRIKKVGYVFLSILIFAASFTNISAHEDDGHYLADTNLSTSEEDQVMLEFDKLQKDIDDTLRVIDGKYIYEYSTVKEIINSFDFSKLNKKLGTSFTKESFLEEVIHSLENTEAVQSNSRKKRASSCNVSKDDSRWNSIRLFIKSSDVPKVTKELRRKNAVEGAGHFLPGFSMIINAVNKLGEANRELQAKTAERMNTGCGIVYDVNKFTGYWFIKDQKDY